MIRGAPNITHNIRIMCAHLPKRTNVEVAEEKKVLSHLSDRHSSVGLFRP